MSNDPLYDMVYNMLNGNDPSDELWDYLSEIEDMIENVGGRLVSRQVVATAIKNFTFSNPGIPLTMKGGE